MIGGFGPKMAALAGEVGDGINIQAFHPRAEELVDIARRTRKEAGQDPDDLLVTAFAGLDQRWLDHHSAERTRMRRLGVDRLILVVDPPYDPHEIHAAGRLIARSRP